jgi:two-component system NtrC family sensor kinase
MKNRKSKAHINQDRSKQPADFRALSNRILERADSGIPRAQFLKEVSKMLVQFSGCDAVRLVLFDRGRRYRCELSRHMNQSFRFELTPPVSGQNSEFTWTSGKNSALEKLCSDIVGKRFDSSLPWFTENGSLWTGDVKGHSIQGLQPADSSQELGISVSKGSHSLALIAVDAGLERIGLLEFESAIPDFFVEQQIESYELVAQTLGIALAHRRLQVALRERVKELTCLYGIAKLVAQPEISLEEVLQKTVELLPPGWLYPDICCARIVLDERSYTTSGFRKPAQSMRADIVVDGNERGFVEVGYVWEKPQLDEGPFLNEERNLIDAIAREVAIIVEQKQDEDEKSKLQEQLRHADRLATIGQLGAGLAHELNEPLANILGFAQLTTKDQGLSDQTRQDIEKIISASLHARDVIGKLLVFARQTTPEKTRTNLNSLVEDGLHFLQSRCAKAGIELLRNLSEGLPEITADRSQLLQVLTNLVVNSVQAMPHGGRLTISTSSGDGHVLLTVEDTGAGMSDEIMKKIFNPFFTTKDVDEGTGLGLSVVHGIVTSHGGTIEVESEVGRGTKFVIQLPVETAVNHKEISNG